MLFADPPRLQVVAALSDLADLLRQLLELQLHRLDPHFQRARAADATHRCRRRATSCGRAGPAAARGARFALARARRRNPLFARYPVPAGRGPLARGGPRRRAPASLARYVFDDRGVPARRTLSLI